MDMEEDKILIGDVIYTKHSPGNVQFFAHFDSRIASR